MCSLCVAVVLSACVATPAPSSAPSNAPAPSSSVKAGYVAPGSCLASISPPKGFVARADDGSVGKLCGQPDQGNFWEANAFVSTEPVRLYRLYSKSQEPPPGSTSRKAGPYGRWWSTEKPSGSREKYRDDYAVCAEWNDLDMVMTCTLPANKAVGIGTSQSVQCPSGHHLAQSKTIQIVVPDAASLEREGSCSSAPWP